MNKDNKRRHFIGRLVGLGGLVLSGAVLIFGKKKKQPGVFLTKDGKLVRVDPGAIKNSRKISKEALKQWINHEEG